MSTIWRTSEKVVTLPAVLPPGKLVLVGSKVSSAMNMRGTAAGENDAGKLRSARGESAKLAKTFYHELIAGRR